ncbi:TonB-dependent receptor plug domain-containing protein [Brevundimonas variabilis]|uniref:Outer membrane receptor protein involved in Fe transport n=1 Tax=Brevundimonas variabilis TaxID=74312 RepID=A0A7W9FCU3_9CAUL|nr:TonB-dependent receptor [Brevundimonas variabilis]MBB5744567.1 outer membrane receptor protein involved in Fe transport [Brevundimonas variabilis]
MKTIKRLSLLGGTALVAVLASSGLALAQTAPQDPAPGDEATVDEIIVVGSQIRGASTTAALPVTVLGQEEILATGAVNGDDLLRSIPQMGDVLFSPANNAQTSNAARGDVNSVNLRSLGVGNTLVLLNGRRIVQHPTSQGTSDTGTVPVLSYNSNAIPVSGLDRLEVLLDGAAAIYGADAVAGVVNTVLETDFDGLRMTTQYGGAESTNLREFDLGIFAGKDFDRGNISAFIDYTDRTALRAEDQNFTETDNLRPLFANEPDYADSLTPDFRNTRGAWANLAVVGATTAIRRGTTALTTAAGAFHIQPTALAGCLVPNGDVCLGSGALNFNGVQRELRFDTAPGTTVLPDTQRLNLFVSGHYELNNDITAFGELGWYQADTQRIQPPVINLNTLTIPAQNYWNPFGPVTFADGRANPNRITGLTNVPVTGLAVTLNQYRFVDAGYQTVDVSNYQARALGGLRGEWRGFDWETALLYSEAEAIDESDAVNTTALQASLALSTPDAYNPFNGGCVAQTSFGDCTPSSQTALDAITFRLKRESRTTLTQYDFKVSRPDLFSLPGGDVGVAFGFEARKETQRDDRDANLDGSNPFRDSVTGAVQLSNVIAVSQNPDTSGERTVTSAYVEFAVPLVSPEMNIPLVRALNVQIAGRAEHYSDFGDVAKPKIAASWDIFDGLRLRGSYSEGFRAPNLEQVNTATYGRLSTNPDYIRCEADLRARRIATFGACSRAVGASLLVSGNPDLEPEESTNTNYGVVFQPQFLPEYWGDFTFTVDRWRIQQEKIVGLFGGRNAVVQDYLDRVQGRSNPLVTRAPVNADDIALFAGTGITPVGVITSISDRFVNLLPQDVEGMDLGLNWRLRNTPLGSFRVNLNAAKLISFGREGGPAVDALYEARAAGIINAATPLPETSELVAQNGRPEWRFSGSLTWSEGPWQVGAFTQYISAVDDNDLLSATGTPWEVDSQVTGNLYVQYEWEENFGLASDARIRVGARNITNEAPPLSSTGYLGSLYRPYGRYWYVTVSKTF